MKSHQEKHISVYKNMLAHVKSSLDNANTRGGQQLQHLIDISIEKAIKIGDISQEEAEKIGTYLKRDIEAYAEYLTDDHNREFKDWLLFDIELIEQYLLEQILSIADQVKLGMLTFEEELSHGGEYKTGEITSATTLTCLTCEEKLHIQDVAVIPECNECHGTIFSKTNANSV